MVQIVKALDIYNFTQKTPNNMKKEIGSLFTNGLRWWFVGKKNK